MKLKELLIAGVGDDRFRQYHAAARSIIDGYGAV